MNKNKRKILIVGGYEPIGLHIGEKLSKDGFEIFVLDENKSNTTYKLKHIFFDIMKELDVDKLFRKHNFFYVIYAKGISSSTRVPLTPLAYLKYILKLSESYKVNKFLYISGVSSSTLNTNEDEGKMDKPKSMEEIKLFLGEKYCKEFYENSDLDICILRLSYVYGIGADNSIIDMILSKDYDLSMVNKLMSKEEYVDYIHIDDVTNAVKKAMIRPTILVMNICTGDSYSFKEVNAIASEIVNSAQSSSAHEHIAVYKNDRARIYLFWKPQHKLCDGMKKIYNENTIMQRKKNNLYEKLSRFCKNNKKTINIISPFCENILCYFTFKFLAIILNKYTFIFVHDINFAYITIVSMKLGLLQGFIAVIIVTIELLIHNSCKVNVSLQLLVKISVYLYISTLIGHIATEKEKKIRSSHRKLEKVQHELKEMTDKYQELRFKIQDSEKVKVNDKENFLEIYEATGRINSLNYAEIFISAIEVIENLMKCSNVGIFVISNNRKHLRLVAQSCEMDKNSYTSKSICVDKNLKLKKYLNNTSVYVNKEMKDGIPNMVCPIVLKEKTVAFIGIYNIKFGDMTLDKQYMLERIANLITTSIGRAYKYEKAIGVQKYIKDTTILKPAFFSEILGCMEYGRIKQGIPYTIIKLIYYYKDMQTLYETIKGNIRSSDFLGLDVKNGVYLVLTNTENQEGTIVIERLKKLKVEGIIMDNASIMAMGEEYFQLLKNEEAVISLINVKQY